MASHSQSLIMRYQALRPLLDRVMHCRWYVAVAMGLLKNEVSAVQKTPDHRKSFRWQLAGHNCHTVLFSILCGCNDVLQQIADVIDEWILDGRSRFNSLLEPTKTCMREFHERLSYIITAATKLPSDSELSHEHVRLANGMQSCLESLEAHYDLLLRFRYVRKWIRLTLSFTVLDSESNGLTSVSEQRKHIQHKLHALSRHRDATAPRLRSERFRTTASYRPRDDHPGHPACLAFRTAHKAAGTTRRPAQCHQTTGSCQPRGPRPRPAVLTVIFGAYQLSRTSG